MRNTLETRLGIFFALALVAGIIIVDIVGGMEFFRGGKTVRAHFENIQELKVGDPVRMAGVQIGRVDGIQLVSNKVDVAMRITKPDQIKTDSVASIRFVGLMGQNYVSLEFGSPQAPVVAENAILATTEQADLSTLMVKLENVASGVDNLTRSLSPDMLSNLIGPFTDFLRENNPRMTAILGNLQTVSTQMAQGEGTVGKLLSDDQLYTQTVAAVSNLNNTADDIRLTVAQARGALEGLTSGQGTLGRLAQDDSLFVETATAMMNLREVLEKINRGQGSVGKLVNDESLFNNAKMTLQKLDKATEGLEDQGPLSILGIAVNGLF